MTSVARYPIPAEETRAEITVLGSRFIATAAPALSVKQAQTFVSRIRSEFSSATHNVPAYQVGYGTTVIAHCNDDGEPSGTAGRPALAVLRGSGLGDVAVVVTRYFGGTKLGTGGLVRAYGDAVREVLAVLPRAEKVATVTVMMAAPYALFAAIRQATTKFSGQIMDSEFAADVTITARFPSEHLAGFEAALGQLSKGQLETVIVARDEATIMPFPASAATE